MVVEVSRLTCRELCMEGAAVEGGVFNAPRDASIPESADLVAIIVAMNDFLQVRRRPLFGGAPTSMSLNSDLQSESCAESLGS